MCYGSPFHLVADIAQYDSAETYLFIINFVK